MILTTEQWQPQPWRRNRNGEVVWAAPPRPTQMMTYPHPIRRPGGIVWARAILPDDLTADEATRIRQMLLAIAIPGAEAKGQ
jgi:hypothetical protein